MGDRTGAVFDDTAEMLTHCDFNAIASVEMETHRKPVTGRDFFTKNTRMEIGFKRTHAVADDSAVSGDAPGFFTLKAFRKGRL